jgi:predicted nucleic acid-binding protein
VRFWDASAVVALCLWQERTRQARTAFQEDPQIAVWWGTHVECASAFARLRRQRVLTNKDEDGALARLAQLRDAWHEVQPGARLREQALRLLRLHGLPVGSSFQLAAAMEWAGSPPAGTLVTFDDGLAEAARLEGFKTAP